MIRNSPVRRRIGLLVHRLEDDYQNQIFKALHEAAGQRDVHLTCLCAGIVDAPHPSGRERNFLFDLVSPEAFDGLIVMSGSLSNHVGTARLAEYCRRFEPIPMCSIGARLDGMPNVLIDNASGLTRAIDGLIDSGRRRVAFIRGPEQNEEAEARHQAYQQTLERRGIALDPQLVIAGDFQKESGARAVATLLDQRGQRVDAIVAASDSMALGALEALLARGIAVPAEVAVTGFDDVEDARFAPVPLSTVRQPLAEQGRRALSLLLEQIETGIPGVDVVLPTEVVVRASSEVEAPRRSAPPDGAAAEYEQAQQRLRQAELIRALRRSGQALSSMLSEHEVLAATRRELPGMGIERALICLYDPANPGPARFRRFRMDALTPSSEPADLASSDVTSASQILGDDAQPYERRRTAVVEPLFSSEGPLGVGWFEVGPLHGSVYEFLREQISAALCASTLVKRLVNETARRQAAEKDQVIHELEIATRIQTGVLPRDLRAPGLELCAGMIAAARVGGDYYDVLPLENGCWLGIGDVAGHGLSTGLIMLMIQSIISGLCTSTPNASPSELLGVINEVLYQNVRERLQRDEHATLALIRYTSDGKLVLAGGHEDIILCRARTGECELIPTPGPWVGAFRDVGDSNIDAHYQLEPGDLVVLYTDGMTEAANANGSLFGLERLCGELQQVQRERVDAIHQHLMQRVLSWQLSQDDDMTLVVARYTG